MKRTATLFASKCLHLHDDDVAAGMPGFLEGYRGKRIPVTVTAVRRLQSGFITTVHVRNEATGKTAFCIRQLRDGDGGEGTRLDRFFTRALDFDGSPWRLRLGRHEHRGIVVLR